MVTTPSQYRSDTNCAAITMNVTRCDVLTRTPCEYHKELESGYIGDIAAVSYLLLEDDQHRHLRTLEYIAIRVKTQAAG